MACDDVIRNERTRNTSKRRTWTHNARSTTISDLVPYADLPDSDRVYVRGIPRGADLDRWLDGADVRVFRGGHYPVIRDGSRVILDTGQWWPRECEIEVAGQAWRWVERRLGEIWRDEIHLLDTPGTTGRDLWMRTPAAAGCPIMSDETQDLVRATSGQGRIETYGGPTPIRGLYEYDMRVAYAAVLRGMPIGEPIFVGGGTSVLHAVVDRNARARALVTAHVPNSWRHVGLIGVPTSAGMSWPAEPGRVIPHVWVDGCELALAVKSGWRIEVEECLLWPEIGEPLRCWGERLVDLLAEAERVLMPIGFAHVRSMLRSIILHTIGAFHGSRHRVEMRASKLEEAPLGARQLSELDDGSVSWVADGPAVWPEAIHPEWSAHIWARNRVRLLEHPAGGGMLTVNRERLVAVRTDAVYLDSPEPDWVAGDDGKVGRWVAKRAIRETVVRPRTGTDLIELRDGAR